MPVEVFTVSSPVRVFCETHLACRQYNAFVESITEEIERWRQRQAATMAEQLQLDEESLQRLQAAGKHVEVKPLATTFQGVDLSPRECVTLQLA